MNVCGSPALGFRLYEVENAPIARGVSYFKLRISPFPLPILLQVIPRRPFQEGAQFARPRGMPQLAQRFRFNLADASRVTANDCPTSSSVCSLPSSSPNRILMTFSSRGVSVFNTEDVCSFKFRLITASDGETTALSSMKSPRCESSSSPIGVSREIGSCATSKSCAPWTPECPCAWRFLPKSARAPVPAQAAGSSAPVC